MKKYIFFTLPFLLFLSCKDNVESLASVSSKIDKRALVKIDSIEKRSQAIPIFGIGRLGSDTEIKLSFKIGGIISKMRADEGQKVRKGKVLATIRSNEIDAQVLKAKQALEKAERDLKRIKKMFAEEAATSENVDDLTTLVEVSKADLSIARFNQKYAKIVSPVSGRIIKRMAESNELIAPGQPVFLLASNEGKAFVMKVNLSDRDIARVKYGDKAIARFDAFPNEVFEGQISLIAESSDSQTGTFEVELTIKSKGKRLRNGYIGRVEIQPESDTPFLAIPMAALVEGDDKGVKIFVPSEDGQTVREIVVEPLQIHADFIAIKQPKVAFSSVVTSGAPYLVDGDSIRVK
ncbi:MAG: multidrug efflux system membrane fusion protein [Saprospiraceae bacterium]|jgi:multidrug efflux system membrane fusion protein